ncbi:MAG: NAD(P)-dependent glycerol-3-phosphate dehydrogenase [Verrucomicrobiota bacterium]|jgi:glycerol-3-phosphate dehydrogenase (NAD(P)+)|nr:NAD(P)-dependent glycerol-3-phosphate dehydrogenase [Verrucomicrobiota bacterium]
MNVTVLGAGAWGTALAKVLQENGHDVTLWGRDAAQLESIKATGENQRYLPGIALGQDWHITHDLAKAVMNRDLLVLAVASRGFRSIAEQLHGFQGCVVSVTKGIENVTGKTMTGILAETMPKARAVALSGPTLAAEVMARMPTAIVAASSRLDDALMVQSLFHLPHFRVYTSSDPLGVEFGGALKNVIAIAAGICQGLGLGDNSKAALVTRGIAEIRRLGIGCGAQAGTFSGLSGLGDLVVTCFSRLSRNRAFGESVGAGGNVDKILKQTVSVVEGYHTAKSAWHLASELGIDAPIAGEVNAMLHRGKSVRKAVEDLLSRQAKEED